MKHTNDVSSDVFESALISLFDMLMVSKWELLRRD